MADNPWQMNWVTVDVDLLLKELNDWSVYFDKEVKLINKISLTITTNKHVLFVNTPAVEFTVKLNYDKVNGPYYSLTFDSFEHTVRCFKITKKQHAQFIKLFKLIYTMKEDKQEMFAKNRIEMIQKIGGLMQNDTNRKKNNQALDTSLKNAVPGDKQE